MVILFQGKLLLESLEIDDGGDGSGPLYIGVNAMRFR